MNATPETRPLHKEISRLTKALADKDKQVQDAITNACFWQKKSNEKHDQLAALTAERDQLRGERDAMQAAMEAAAEACGKHAERVALDMDHGNRDHSKWWKAVEKFNRLTTELATLRSTDPSQTKGER